MGSNSDMSVEDIVVLQLMTSDGYFDKVLPFIKKPYFEESENMQIFRAIDSYAKKYEQRPAFPAIKLNIEKLSGITDKELDDTIEKLMKIEKISSSDHGIDLQWSIDETEQWVRDRAAYGVMAKAAKQMGTGEPLGNIPDELNEALAISFDFTIGHDYMEEAEERYDKYHDDSLRIAFPISGLTEATGGGPPVGTLTCFMSTQTGGFKSGTMADWACDLTRRGIDSLYITLELAEEMVAKRFDANLMDITLDTLDDLSKQSYLVASDRIKKSYSGRCIIKDYPTSSAHAGHFRFLLKELAQKKNFRPKVVFIDYLNICASSRLSGSNVNSYTYVKAIAEELRGLAKEFGFACITATQGNRGAVNGSDVSLTDVSESIGLPATCDIFIGIITNDDLDRMNQLVFKILKNRFGDISMMKYITAGVNKAKMKLYDLGRASVRSRLPDENESSNEIEKNDSKRSSRRKGDFTNINF